MTPHIANFSWIRSNAARPTMSLGITFDSADEVKKAYAALAREGTVLFPLGSLPWSSCCAEVVDKYGVCWYLTV